MKYSVVRLIFNEMPYIKPNPHMHAHYQPQFTTWFWLFVKNQGMRTSRQDD